MKNRDLEKEFEEKYSTYGVMLYRISFLYLGNAADAEDILHEVFIKYLYIKKKFNSAEHEKAWLIRTTQNCCLDMLKKAGRKNINIDDLSVSVQNENDTTAGCNTKRSGFAAKIQSRNNTVLLQRIFC